MAALHLEKQGHIWGQKVEVRGQVVHCLRNFTVLSDKIWTLYTVM